jgi:tetratricopeptide (TPR) repeat protein
MVRKNNPNNNLLSNYRNILVCLLLVFALLLVYSPAIKGGYIWDDNNYVTDNVHLRSWHGLKNIWFKLGATPQYYPMIFSIFWLEYHLWGLNPFGYHFVNVLFHVANALLLWLVLRRLGISGSLFIAAVFALHPVHVESVAWITEYKNTVSGFFYLSAILFYLRFYKLDEISAGKNPPNDIDSESKSGQGSWIIYVLCLLLYIGALLSKTVTATMPAVLILLIWWKQERLHLNDILMLVPFFLLSIGFGLLTIWMEKYHVGAIGEEWSLSIIDRFLVAGRALWFYAGKLLWPQKLTFIYPRWEINAAIWQQYLFPLTAISVMAALWLLRHRIGKAPLAAVLFFAGTLFPALGFFNVYPQRYSFVADHFQYLASIGIIALVVSVGTKIFFKLGNERQFLGLASGLIVLAVLGILTFKQGQIYKDSETLYRDTITKNEQCWMAYNNLGNILTEQGRLKEAIDHYRQALRIDPDFAGAHNNLGFALETQGYPEEAMDHYLQALRIDPDYGGAHYNLGLAFYRKGNIEKTIAHFRKALQIDSDDTETMYRLAKLYVSTSEYEKALSLYQKLIVLLPDKPAVDYNIACIYARQNRPETSVLWLKKAEAKGFNDLEHIKNDSDLDNIRDSSYYQEFLTNH